MVNNDPRDMHRRVNSDFAALQTVLNSSRLRPSCFAEYKAKSALLTKRLKSGALVPWKPKIPKLEVPSRLRAPDVMCEPNEWKGISNRTEFFVENEPTHTCSLTGLREDRLLCFCWYMSASARASISSIPQPWLSLPGTTPMLKERW